MRALFVLLVLIVVVVVVGARAVDRYYDHQEYLSRPAAWRMTMESQQLSAEREGGDLTWLFVGMAVVGVGALTLVLLAPVLQYATKLSGEARRWRRPKRTRPRHQDQGIPPVQMMRPLDYPDVLQLPAGDAEEGRPFTPRNARLARFRLRD